MRCKRCNVVAVFLVLLAVSGTWAWAQPLPGNLILNVPDWNQPSNYGVAGYANWCSPTAGGNVMGYWEDVMGCVGLTDRQVMPNGPAYANKPNTYQQGLSNDGQVEMGFYMGTQGWVNPNAQFPPNTAFGTALGMIGPGLKAYALASWVDPTSGIVKVAYPATTTGKDVKPSTPLMWQRYTNEINAGRPVLCSFDKWVDPQQFLGNVTIIGFPSQQLEKYPWDLDTDPHTVVGVGYIDITPGFQNNGQDEWFVCQDGWPGPGGGFGGTGQYVVVPRDTMWQQNDYVFNVPEPVTVLLLLVGAGVLRRRRRC